MESRFANTVSSSSVFLGLGAFYTKYQCKLSKSSSVFNKKSRSSCRVKFTQKCCGFSNDFLFPPRKKIAQILSEKQLFKQLNRIIVTLAAFIKLLNSRNVAAMLKSSLSIHC